MTQEYTTPKFGTFLGVFTPSILTILGLIMYLRFGWVVGNVGLVKTMVIVLLASAITFITGLSASAIATNIKVGAGGEYFLISRSLGIELGGAIGIPLYFCRTLSVTFYCFGLAEAILVFWPGGVGELPGFVLPGITAILIITVTLLSGKSASLTLKTQIPIMILVGLSILALILGVLTNPIQAPVMESTYTTAPEGFWYVFAVFFPAVTGFTAGIGLSGDLKDPGQSIPRGTLGAVAVGAMIYLLIPILFSVTGALTAEQLADPDAGLLSWSRVAIFGSVLIIPAVWGAILSSAFGSILSGPRVLQALSNDGLAPRRFAILSKTGQPTVATWVTGLIALLAVMLGELNTVAMLVSMLFLTLYVTINISAMVEDLVNEPSYRPKVRVPWYVSMAGGLGSIGVILLINPVAGIGALAIVVMLYIWLRTRSLEQQWGDVSAGFWINIARYAMLQLKSRTIHGRNWRPFMLIFVRNIDKRIQMIRLAEALGQNHGILTIAHLDFTNDVISPDHRKRREIEMTNTLARYELQAFCEVHAVSDFHKGITEIVNGHGLGDLKTNTVVFGMSEDQAGRIRALTTIKDLSKAGVSILLCSMRAEMPRKGERIDIWWNVLHPENGDFMLLLAYLLKLNTGWKNARIRVLAAADNAREKSDIEKRIKAMIPTSRIQASVAVVHGAEDFVSVLHAKSGSSDVVFIGLPDTELKDEVTAASEMIEISDGLRVTVFLQHGMI